MLCNEQHVVHTSDASCAQAMRRACGDASCTRAMHRARDVHAGDALCTRLTRRAWGHAQLLGRAGGTVNWLRLGLPESNLELVPEPCPWWRVASTAATTGGTWNEGETDGEGKTDGEGETDGEGKRDGEGERDGQPPEGQSGRDILSRRGRGRDTRGRDAVQEG
ncbi:hypothetical protein BJV77DRAFT_1153145 [Russula vinacea]|nr:hypothetical protein BJV77DRAFT_1153145 [Russula vinacea]